MTHRDKIAYGPGKRHDSRTTAQRILELNKIISTDAIILYYYLTEKLGGVGNEPNATETWPSVSTMAKDLGWKSTKTKDITRELANAGLIIKHPRFNAPTHYEIVTLEDRIIPIQKPSNRQTKSRPFGADAISSPNNKTESLSPSSAYIYDGLKYCYVSPDYKEFCEQCVQARTHAQNSSDQGWDEDDTAPKSVENFIDDINEMEMK